MALFHGGSVMNYRPIFWSEATIFKVKNDFTMDLLQIRSFHVTRC